MKKPTTEPTRAFVIANLVMYDPIYSMVHGKVLDAIDDEAAGKVISKSWGFKHWAGYDQAAKIIRDAGTPAKRRRS